MAGTDGGYGRGFAGCALALALFAAVAATASSPSVADAAIDVYANNEQATHLAEFRSGKCRIRRGSSADAFFGEAKSTNGAYVLNVDIYDFRGFDRRYNVPFGVINPTVSFESRSGGGADFTNNYAFPGTPPPSSGAIAFPSGRRKLGVGVYTLPNADYSEAVSVAGQMRCRYPRR